MWRSCVQIRLHRRWFFFFYFLSTSLNSLLLVKLGTTSSRLPEHRGFPVNVRSALTTTTTAVFCLGSNTADEWLQFPLTSCDHRHKTRHGSSALCRNRPSTRVKDSHVQHTLFTLAARVKLTDSLVPARTVLIRHFTSHIIPIFLPIGHQSDISTSPASPAEQNSSRQTSGQMEGWRDGEKG